MWREEVGGPLKVRGSCLISNTDSEDRSLKGKLCHMKPAVEERVPKGSGIQLERLEVQVDAYQSLNHFEEASPCLRKEETISERKGASIHL